jgi:hypothetical protein
LTAGAQECAPLNFQRIFDEHRNLFAYIAGVAAPACF